MAKSITNLPPMSHLRRDLFHKVMDGDGRILPLLYHFDMMRRCDEYLVLLVRSGLVGNNLYEWFYNEMKGSPLKSISVLTKYLEKQKNVRSLFEGRDFLSNGKS